MTRPKGVKLQKELYKRWTSEEGWTYKKLAKEYGISWHTVENYLMRERNYLRLVEEIKKSNS